MGMRFQDAMPRGEVVGHGDTVQEAIADRDRQLNELGFTYAPFGEPKPSWWPSIRMTRGCWVVFWLTFTIFGAAVLLLGCSTRAERAALDAEAPGFAAFVISWAGLYCPDGTVDEADHVAAAMAWNSARDHEAYVRGMHKAHEFISKLSEDDKDKLCDGIATIDFAKTLEVIRGEGK